MDALEDDALYGIGRVAKELRCSASTVRRMADKAGIAVDRSSGHRKFTGQQVHQLRESQASHGRYPDRPPDTLTVSEVARKLWVMPDTIRKAIKRVEARNPGIRILRPREVTDYGERKEIWLVDSAQVGLIESALRSPRTKKPTYFHKKSVARRKRRKREARKDGLEAVRALTDKGWLELLHALITVNVVYRLARDKLPVSVSLQEARSGARMVNMRFARLLLGREPRTEELDALEEDFPQA